MVDATLASMERPAIDGFRYLLRAMEVGTTIARGRRFTELDIEDAREVVDIWSSEDPFPRRALSDSFKVVVGMGFFRRPEVIAEVGWRRGCP